MNTLVRRIVLVLIATGVVTAIVFALQPQPVLVDVATIQQGPLVVTINDDGQTRIRERYVVSAPLNGRLVRISLNPGDEVKATETILTTIEPTDPSLLDSRAVAQAEARVKAAKARLALATPRLKSATDELNLAETELGRLQRLQQKNAATERELLQQQTSFRLAGNDYNAARFEQEIAAFELEQAKAVLLRANDEETKQQDAWNFPITSPVSGRVLRVFQESSTVVQAGDRILELGDPQDLEVVVDVLSRDAVRIRPGARVMLTEWGGTESLDAVVRLIEPSAFTKVSALGIEEQRVNVIIDFVDPPDSRPSLGDAFRIEAAIVRWEAANVLTVPSGALFRESGDWAVFVASNGSAKLRRVKLGERNDQTAEVLGGLTSGEQVILYPGDRIEDGVAIAERAD